MPFGPITTDIYGTRVTSHNLSTDISARNVLAILQGITSFYNREVLRNIPLTNKREKKLGTFWFKRILHKASTKQLSIPQGIAKLIEIQGDFQKHNTPLRGN